MQPDALYESVHREFDGLYYLLGMIFFGKIFVLKSTTKYFQTFQNSVFTYIWYDLSFEGRRYLLYFSIEFSKFCNYRTFDPTISIL